MVDAEKNLISSIIMDPKSIAKMNVTPEMFSDAVYRQIFKNCKDWEEAGEEINAIRIAESLISGYVQKADANSIVADIVSSRDASASDEYCCNELRKRFRAKKANEVLRRTKIVPDNIDSVLVELTHEFDTLKETKDARAVRMSDLVRYSGDYFKSRGLKVFDTGLHDLDETIGSFDAGDMIIIAARPSVGKSAFALQIARRYAKKGLRVAYFNLEMTAKQMYERAIAGASGIGMRRIRNAASFENGEKEKFAKGNEALKSETNLFLYNGTLSVSDIRAEQFKQEYDVIFVDYLQLVRPDQPRGSRQQEVGEISRGLKRIAMDGNIPVFALSQLNRVSEQNKDKEPSMAELREAGDLEQDASTILIMWNPASDDKSEKMIKVEKGRQTGGTRQKLKFNGAKMLFTEDNDFKPADMDEIPF